MDEALGICVDGKTRQATLSEKRFSRLRGALYWILQQRQVSGKQLEILVGHLTFAFMLCRPLLSCLSATYRYIRAHYTIRTKLWDSVVNELTACQRLLPLVCSRWDSPFSSTVTAYDACESGFGVVSSTWPVTDIFECAKHSERQRFKLTRIPARSRALGEVWGEPGGAWDFGTTLGRHQTNLETFSEVADFPEVPRAMIEGVHWSHVYSGRYLRKEAMHIKESRA
eukprot:6485497-Amphidinium_carterae.1